MIKKYIVTICFCMLFSSFPVYASDSESVSSVPSIVDTSNHNYTFAEMETDICQLVQSYPGLISYEMAGTSTDGRGIYELILGNKNAPNAIYIQAAIHGREWMNSMMLMKQIEELLKQWNYPYADTTVGNILNQCCIYIIPMVNPDGVSISQLGLNGINTADLRTYVASLPGANNFSKWKANAKGVDINRNFGTGWNNKVDCSVPSSEAYNGTAPLTEKESLAVATGFSKRKFQVAISYHSMEGAVYWDIGQTGAIRDQTKTLATHIKNITGYRLGSASPLKGLDYNYFIFEKNTPSVVIETGYVACPLPYSQWNTLWKENRNVMITLASIYQ